MFRGNYKFKNSSGFNVTYSRNDIVLYHGKVYKSVKTTQNSPQNKECWEFISLTEPYYGSLPPVNPKINQIWISDEGKNYFYTYDGTSYQWIET